MVLPVGGTSGVMALAGELSPAEARGKAIYTEGVSPRGRPLTAELVGGLELPGEHNPCGRCHGVDGRGGVEGGILMPNVRWEHLSAPYGVPTYLGGTRPPYTEETLRRSIRDGLDSAGNPFDELMPRYAIDDEDLADLVAYLKAIGAEEAPGTSAQAIRIGALLPLSGPLARQGRAVEQLLSRYFERINAAGGVYGRQIEYVARDSGPTGATALEAARGLIEGPDAVFCFLANAGLGADPRVLKLLGDHEVPLVGPLTFPRGVPRRGPVFYFLASLRDQARAGASFLAREPNRGEEPVAFVRGIGAGAQEMADAFAAEARQLGLRLVVEEWGHEGLPDLVTRLHRAGGTPLVFFGSLNEVERLVDEAARQEWSPRLVASTVLLGGGLKAPGGTVLISPPIAPGVSHPGAAEFSSIVESADTSGSAARGGASDVARNRAMEMAAFAAAKLLAESLKLTGRELRRDKFLETLRQVREFETGVMPPVTFGPNRRLGIRGALIVSTDDAGRVIGSDWIEVEKPNM
jgi:ABC-type branched-subunit amino acid transport system substrate-binding protein